MKLSTHYRDQISEYVDGFFVKLGATVHGVFTEAGGVAIFFFKSLKLVFEKPFRSEEIVRHMEFVGNKSILIIAMTGCFTGMALAYQIYIGFNLIGATNLVGPTVALGISRELGPVLTGLIVAARAGGAMAARLATMRVSEQIDAIEVMGIDPKQFLVAPRIVAALISTPLLCGVFDFVAMVGAHFLCINVLSLDEAIFWDKIQQWIQPKDINEGLIKSAVFGAMFAAVCTKKGYYATGGAKGVGEATNGGVVNSMVLIIVLNFFMTNILRFFYKLLGI